MMQTQAGHLVVVVGVDGSGTDGAAARWAIQHAKRTNQRLLAVYASDSEIMAGRLAASGLIQTGALVEAEREHAEAVGHDVRELAGKLGVDIEFIVERGSPIAALLNHEDQAAVFVVGTGRKTGFQEFVLGTTSIGLSAHAHRPVAVINPEVDPDALNHGRVGVAIDGSPDSIAGAKTAFELAAQTGATVVAITTWFVQMRGGYVVTEPDSPEWLEVEGEHRAMVESCLTTARKAYPQVPVEVEVHRGPAVTTLADFSGTVDALVIGSRGRGTVRGRLLGSVSQRLMRVALSPVIVATRDQH